MPRVRVHPYPHQTDDQYAQSALPEPPKRVPETDMQALMEAPPGEEPLESQEQLQPRLEAVRSAMDTLTDRERWIVEAYYWRRISLRDIGAELNLVHGYVDRLLKRALAKMEAEIEEG